MDADCAPWPCTVVVGAAPTRYSAPHPDVSLAKMCARQNCTPSPNPIDNNSDNCITLHWPGKRLQVEPSRPVAQQMEQYRPETGIDMSARVDSRRSRSAPVRRQLRCALLAVGQWLSRQSAPGLSGSTLQFKPQLYQPYASAGQGPTFAGRADRVPGHLAAGRLSPVLGRPPAAAAPTAARRTGRSGSTAIIVCRRICCCCLRRSLARTAI